MVVRNACGCNPGVRIGSAVIELALCNKWIQRERCFFVKFDSIPSLVFRETRQQCEAARRTKVKKLGGLLVAGALGVGLVGAAQAHVSIGVGIGVPAYPVYAAPPAPVYMAPPQPVYVAPPPPVVYAPPPAVVVGGYGGYGYYGRPYYRHHGYYRHGPGYWRH
jgi:hypothetical protein